MLRRMSCRQLMEWQAFDILEPFGPERADLRSGAILNVLMNAHRDVKKQRKPFTLAECVPMFGDSERPKKRMTWQQMQAVAIQLTAENRAEHRRKRGS